MTPTSYATFLQALAGIEVEGVILPLAVPPVRVETADLPASFATALEGMVLEEDYMTVQTFGGWPILRGNLVVLVEAAGQDTVPTNHVAVVEMVDAVVDALRGLPVGSLGKGHLRWAVEVRADYILGDQAYWAVVTTVEGEG